MKTREDEIKEEINELFEELENLVPEKELTYDEEIRKMLINQ